jgi:hypothetical protein
MRRKIVKRKIKLWLQLVGNSSREGKAKREREREREKEREKESLKKTIRELTSLADSGVLTLMRFFLIKQCVKQNGNYSI